MPLYVEGDGPSVEHPDIERLVPPERSSLEVEARRAYPHRVPYADKHGWCVVCCGDRITSDRRFAAGPAIPDSRTPAPIYRCGVCGS